MLLETVGYTIISATTRDEACKAVEQMNRRPDFIISDYHLADSSTGVETISALRSQCSSIIPALIITGDTSRVVDSARSILNCELLNKPIDPDNLLRLIADYMDAS